MSSSKPAHHQRTKSTELPMRLGQPMSGAHHLSPLQPPAAELPRTLSDLVRNISPPHSPAFLSKLPPAVAAVSQDDVRSYVHSKRVTHYMISSMLGEGTFAKVKEGFHVLVGEKVAVKVIDKKKAMLDTYVAKNFRREAKLLQMVHHPNILQLLEVVETDNSYYLITELCSGGELMKYIYKMGKLDEVEGRKIMRQIVQAVDHLHRAGIIHRDLKVENLLLDGAGNIKIIDFGLSNEEYVQDNAGRVHCSTQCGSPAYAAPELLGHKEYGPDVDIWSIGVNMYAMLTGCLPYTVEPFNITALHAKMLENKMNPIPSSLTEDCRDLLQKLLISNPSERIKMEALMEHPWLNRGCPLLRPALFPNKLTANDLNEDIIEHMTYILKLKRTEEEVKEELLTNKASSISAVYYLISARLERYNKQKPVRVRKRAKTLSNRGSHYNMYDTDDAQSLMSCPARLKKDQTPQQRGTLRPITRATKTRPLHNGGLAETDPRPATTRLQKRRNTLPPELMENDIAQLRNRKPPTTTPVQPSPHKFKSLPRGGQAKDTTFNPERGYEHDQLRPGTQLNPVRPPRAWRNSTGYSRDLSELAQDLSRHIAWNSQPSSRASSLVGSRNSSRQPSASSKRTSTSSLSHRLSHTDLDSDINFHEVESSATSYSSPRKHSSPQRQSVSPANSTLHFPSIPQSGMRERSRTVPGRKNGSVSLNDVIRLKTEMATPLVVSKLNKIAEKLNIAPQEQKGSILYFKSRGIRFQVSIEKEASDTYLLHFHWLSGGGFATYGDIRDKMVDKISA